MPLGSCLPLLADLGLERTPGAERGLRALAGIAVGLALFAAWRAWRDFRAASPSVSGHGRAEAARILRGVLQLVAGIAAVYGAALWLRPTPQRPAGWGLLPAPPGECGVLALHDGLLWVGAREGLFAFDPATRTPRLAAELGVLDLRGTRALLAEGDALWVGSRRGLGRWRGGRLETVRPPGVDDPGPVSALLRRRDGALWVGVRDGLWECRGDPADAAAAWRFVGARDGLRLPTVDVIHEAPDGTVWVGSIEPEAEGLFRQRPGGTWECFGVTAGLPSAAVNDLRVDAGGVLWVGTGFGLRGGAARWDGVRWQPERIEPLASQKIRSLHLDAAGRLWFCSEYDGLAFRQSDGRWQHFHLAHGLPGNEVKQALRAPEGTLWLATERGLGFIREPEGNSKLETRNSKEVKEVRNSKLEKTRAPGP
ncbi:MAG: hypothetical protein JSR82_12370 [Verrucomicrobia bacterium]|nr:hypothetical protein [Verrucomicrobiota bacterium]